MSDDLNTINANRAKVFGRDVGALRKRYLQHRELLGRLTTDAPTEHLAREYARLQTEIDAAVTKLDELERGAPPDAPTEPGRSAVPPSPPPPRTAPPAIPRNPPREQRAAWQNAPIAPAAQPEPNGGNAGFRSALIVVAGLFVLGVIAFLVWYFLSAERPPEALRDTPETSTVITETQEPVPVPKTVPLSATPGDFNYGTIRKGTRATHQFTLANGTDETITIATSRSQCRCLWFKHAPTVPPRGTTALTITVDGGRAKKGPVDEQVQVTAKGRTDAAAAIHVVANVE